MSLCLVNALNASTGWHLAHDIHDHLNVHSILSRSGYTIFFFSFWEGGQDIHDLRTGQLFQHFEIALELQASFQKNHVI